MVLERRVEERKEKQLQQLLLLPNLEASPCFMFRGALSVSLSVAQAASVCLFLLPTCTFFEIDEPQLISFSQKTSSVVTRAMSGDIRHNLGFVRERIETVQTGENVRARLRCSVRFSSQVPPLLFTKVTLVAVSKTKEEADIMEAYEAGHRDFGENYVRAGFDLKIFQ